MATEKKNNQNGGRPKRKKLKINKRESTAPGIPRRSPIQVLTGLDAAWLRWSDENRYFQRDMAVDNYHIFSHLFKFLRRCLQSHDQSGDTLSVCRSFRAAPRLPNWNQFTECLPATIYFVSKCKLLSVFLADLWRHRKTASSQITLGYCINQGSWARHFDLKSKIDRCTV